MNIKQAELLSGISKRNIRFYEQEGLISPTRNQENDYREYSEEDINILKLIRALRMIDMPLEQIKDVIGGQTALKDAAQEQKNKLKLQIEQLEGAIRFCEEFGTHGDINNINIDEVLSRMDSPENKKELFWQWVNDYQKVATAEHEKVFSFIPDDPVTTPSEFTLALLKYAENNELNIYITKEGMYPKFTLNGIEYTAKRFYTSIGYKIKVPVVGIRCEAVHPEDFEPDVPEKQKKLFKFFHHNWITILLTVIILVVGIIGSLNGWMNTLEYWIVLLAIPVLISIMQYFHSYFGYREYEKKKQH